MSNYIGIILSDDTPESVIDDICRKYDIEILPVENASLNKSLRENERFFELSRYGRNIGISRYKSYLSHFTDMEECIKVWGFDMYYRNITEINENWLADANRWANIIRDLRYNYKIRSVGIINFYANDRVCNLEFPPIPRTEIKVSEITAFTMMNLNTETIYMFT